MASDVITVKKVESVVRKAVATLSLEAEITKVTDWADINKDPILSTLGLVVNEKLACAGYIPAESAVTTWLANALETV